MPDTATAPTATAAQTSAPGSRMLGFYLGGGGAKVDALFDPAQFVHANGGGNYAAPGASGFRMDFQNSGDALRGAAVRVTGSAASGTAEFGTTSSGYKLRFSIDLTGGWEISTGLHLLPIATNAQDVGGGSNRVRNIYLQNSPNVSSDARLKHIRGADGGPSAAEISWAMALRPVAYQMLDAIALKGEAGARLHWGLIAQDVWQAGIDAGIDDPFRYGFLGRNPKTKPDVQRVSVERQKTRMISDVETAIEMIDGRAVLSQRPVERPEPLFIEHPVYGADGKLLMVEVRPGLLEPLIHHLPDMETVEVEQEVTVPVLGEDGEPEFIWNIRYDELLMFLFACGALAHA